MAAALPPRLCGAGRLGFRSLGKLLPAPETAHLQRVPVRRSGSRQKAEKATEDGRLTVFLLSRGSGVRVPPGAPLFPGSNPEFNHFGRYPPGGLEILPRDCGLHRSTNLLLGIKAGRLHPTDSRSSIRRRVGMPIWRCASAKSEPIQPRARQEPRRRTDTVAEPGLSIHQDFRGRHGGTNCDV
jgi:hypothetical protein